MHADVHHFLDPLQPPSFFSLRFEGVSKTGFGNIDFILGEPIGCCSF